MDVVLSTPRLLLRQPCLSDAARLTRLLNNFHVSGNLSRVPYPYTEADALSWLRSWRPDRPAGETGFTIDLPGEGLIGHCGFHADQQGTVIGYWLGEPFWNRGFMTEAAAAIIDWYFATTGADDLPSGVFAFNKASLCVQKKLGFTETGTSTRHCLARKQDLRHIDTTLTRADWAQRTGRAAAKEAS